MHEASLVTWLVHRVEAVAAEEKAARVTRVAVRVGALSPVSAAHLSEHFTRAATGTVAGNAALDVTVSADVSDPAAGGIVLEGVEVEH
jgi:Zn finger protein HypA/HybF involved in hydrogenase expression